MQFRPKHLIWLLVLLIFLESVILYLNSKTDTPQVSGEPHPKERIRHHGKSHSGRDLDAPRIAIVTLQGLVHHHGPTNSKGYAHRHGYDFVDAAKSVNAAVQALRAARADPSFIRVFAIMRFLPLYDWVFWHDADSIFLNFSRTVDEYLDKRYDMILTANPCGSNEAGQVNLGHMLIQNTKTSLKTLKSIWGLWNHTTCKYGEQEEPQLCRVTNGRAAYHQGVKGALRTVLAHCEVCASKTKYTGFRAFNSIYPCHGQGDLLVHFPGLNATFRKEVVSEFIEHSSLDDGTFNESIPLLGGVKSGQCASPADYACAGRHECDRLYHGLNTHGKCSVHGHGAKLENKDHEGRGRRDSSIGHGATRNRL